MLQGGHTRPSSVGAQPYPVVDEVRRNHFTRGLPRELRRVRDVIADGLATTAEQWPAIRIAFGWLHQAAQLLNNAAGRSIGSLRRAYRRLLATIGQGAQRVGLLEPAVRHFLKVTASYWPGLFVCYHRPDIPRTNNDLEHVFGSVRYHERRASGRKVAAPTFLVRSSVRLLSAASQQQAFTSADLQPKNLNDWRALRQELAQRHTTRALQRRFRQDPVAYLADAERLLHPESLPP